ncbi:MAG: histidine utilization repressor [Rhodobacteraceae bacterium]|nr:histidine utilization repressor [Paracoccaceae bacterium]MAY45376.1 histidine utilization repressor [Paracoccaceae bacterium]
MIKDETFHQRILKDLEGKIVSGEWPPGHRLPFEVDLAKAYGCSRMTVNKVMTQLVQGGLIERRKRSGSFVLQPKVSSAVLEIPDVEQDVERQGLPYSYTLDHQVQRKATDADMRDMDLSGPAPILAITCTHFAGHRPYCHEERLINLTAVPDALDTDFKVTAPGQWLLRQVPWSTAEHRIGAINADSDLAKTLQVPQNAACLTLERRTWSDNGPVTYVRLVYPGDRQSLVARFQPAAG